MNNLEKKAIEGQIAVLEGALATLKALVNDSTKESVKGPVKEVTKPIKERLASMTAEEVVTTANAILVASGLEYEGKATRMEISYAIEVHEGFEVPFLNRNKLLIVIRDIEDNVLTQGVFNKNKFAKFYPQLGFLGVFEYHKDHTARTVLLDL